MGKNVFRAIVGAAAWTMFAILMASKPEANSVVKHALLVGTVAVYAVCAWKLLQKNEPPNIQSGPKHDAYKRLHHDRS